jgi:hypothetical protein
LSCGAAAVIPDNKVAAVRALSFVTLVNEATRILPGSVTVTHRTGEPLTKMWGNDATGYGWVFVDDALALVK